MSQHCNYPDSSKPLLTDDHDQFMMHDEHHSCWCASNASSQGISIMVLTHSVYCWLNEVITESLSHSRTVLASRDAVNTEIIDYYQQGNVIHNIIHISPKILFVELIIQQILMNFALSSIILRIISIAVNVVYRIVHFLFKVRMTAPRFVIRFENSSAASDLFLWLLIGYLILLTWIESNHIGDK